MTINPTDEVDDLLVRQIQYYRLADQLLDKWFNEAFEGDFSLFGDGVTRTESLCNLIDALSTHSSSLIKLRESLPPTRLRSVP